MTFGNHVQFARIQFVDDLWERYLMYRIIVLHAIDMCADDINQSIEQCIEDHNITISSAASTRDLWLLEYHSNEELDNIVGDYMFFNRIGESRWDLLFNEAWKVLCIIDPDFTAVKILYV